LAKKEAYVMSTSSTSEDSSSSFGALTTLVASFVSVVLTVFIIAYAVTNVRATANFIVRVAAGGAARIQQIATSLLGQSSAVVESLIPAVEQAVTDVGNIVLNGVALGFNTILAVGESLVCVHRITLCNHYNLIVFCVCVVGSRS
jgi:hypothetical protein